MVGRAITSLLKALGLKGFPLFAADAGICLVIVIIAYLIGSHGLGSRKREETRKPL